MPYPFCLEVRDLDFLVLLAAEGLLGGGTRGDCYGSALWSLRSGQPRALTADISLASACSVSVAIYVLKVELG